MKNRTTVLALVVVIQILILMGCGQDKSGEAPKVSFGSTPTVTPMTTSSPVISPNNVISPITGYVLATNNQAAFIRWTEKDKQLNATLVIGETVTATEGTDEGAAAYVVWFRMDRYARTRHLASGS